jgi:hypothetical protein
VDLPAPVERYLETAYPGGWPDVTTAVVEGSGRFRRRPLPWMPFRNQIHLRAGLDRVSDMQVVLGRVTLMKVLDAYVDGHGITRVPWGADVGAKIDQGSVHPLLCEALSLPSCWPRMAGFAWEGVDERTARMLLPFQGGVEAGTVGFDPETGYPRAYDTPRFQGAGPKVDWHVDLLDWRRFGAVAFPARVSAAWANQPGPWLQERFEQVRLGEDVDEPIERARAAIAKATS